MDRAIRRVVFSVVLILAGLQACKKNSSPAAPVNPPAPSDTSTFTPVPTGTSSPTSTTTFTPSFTHTPTSTPIPPSTPTFTASSTRTFTITPSPTPVPSSTATFTATPTHTGSPTPTGTSTATRTPTHTFTATATPTSTWTNTIPPTSTPTVTFTVTEIVSCGNPAQFGTGSIGANGGIPSGFVHFNKAVVYDQGTVTAISFYLTGGSNNVQVGLYSDASGFPGSLLSVSAGTAVSGAGWKTLDIPDAPVSGPTTYWLGIQANSTGPVAWDPTGSTFYRVPNTYGTFPATVSSPQPWNYNWSLVAEYCLPNGVPSHTPTASRTPTPTSTHTPTFTVTPTPLCTNPAQFGTSSIGPNGGIPSGFVHFNRAMVLDAGTVTSLSFYLTGGSNSVQVGIYDDNGGVPGTLLSSSSPTAVSGAGWKTLVVAPLAVNGPTTYWLGIQANSTGPVAWDTASTTNYRVANTFGTFPATVTSPGTWGYDWSLVANYCLPGGVNTHTPTATRTFTPTFTATATFTVTQTPACGSPASLGTSSIGGNGGIPSGYVHFNQAVASSTGTAISVSFYMTGGSNTVQAGIYSDNLGQPATLLGASSPTAFSGTGWKTLDIQDAAIASGSTYWIGIQANSSGPIAWTTASTTNYRVVNAFGTFPATVSSPETWGYDWSLYANVCP